MHTHIVDALLAYYHWTIVNHFGQNAAYLFGKSACLNVFHLGPFERRHDPGGLACLGAVVLRCAATGRLGAAQGAACGDEDRRYTVGSRIPSHEKNKTIRPYGICTPGLCLCMYVRISLCKYMYSIQLSSSKTEVPNLPFMILKLCFQAPSSPSSTYHWHRQVRGRPSWRCCRPS